MYLPRHFDETRLPVLHELMRRHPLAAVVARCDERLEANHIPLVLDPSSGPHGCLRGHIARANPMWQAVAAGAEVLAIFQGPEAYVSPGYYPSKQAHGEVVPTWNYAVVHARGTVSWVHDPAWLLSLVESLTATHEAQQPSPWEVADAPDQYIAKMLEAIVGIEITLTGLQGKFKLSQNRAAADRAGVRAGLRQRGEAGTEEMLQLMGGQDGERS